jgi:hypothetical protein
MLVSPVSHDGIKDCIRKSHLLLKILDMDMDMEAISLIFPYSSTEDTLRLKLIAWQSSRWKIFPAPLLACDGFEASFKLSG